MSALIAPEIVALPRRACRSCGGSGRDRVMRLQRCTRCQGSGSMAPRGHFEARYGPGDEMQPGDGCNADHTRVLRPCEECDKGPDDLRHLCKLLDAGKPCEEHHAWRPGGSPDATREGCREHEVTREYVLRWWAVADEQGRDVGVCHCCLAPAPADDHGIPRGMCYRCRPRVAGGDA